MRDKNLHYFCKFSSTDGHVHYAVHSYDKISGLVTMMKDLKFEGIDYSQEEELNKDLPVGRYFLEEDKDMVLVLDRITGKTIGNFTDNKLANDFCDYLNGNNELLEDDPWT